MTDASWQLDLGAQPVDGGVSFRVWAPSVQSMSVLITDTTPNPTYSMSRQHNGYFEVMVRDLAIGARYLYRLDDALQRPDPASRWQPDGVHGSSAVVDPGAFHWSDQHWSGLPPEAFIIYELHTGTFTPAGTFEGIIPRLEYLRDSLGVTAIELMPVAQFPGSRNWGYDGVFPFAPQASYGGPEGLKRLVDACHRHGLAVILDVVYNHLGPEGNYLRDYGPYFTNRYHTPWGDAINYDGPGSDEVRHYVINNALYWLSEFHLDALRLDAIHGIFDFSPSHILRDLADAVRVHGQRLNRRLSLIAESDLNDVRVIAPPTEGGYGVDAQWSDDFHHALHTVLTDERVGYYQDFGELSQFAAAWVDGFVYTGQYSRHRCRRHGTSLKGRPASQLVVFSQNHDQVGNRAQGERLSRLVPRDALKVAAMAVLLSPNVPLLFMGEEHGEQAPFLYFTDHSDPALQEAVRRGRQAEFAAFAWQGEVPDPQATTTFEQSRIDQDPLKDPQQAALMGWYRALIGLRKSVRCLGAAQNSEQGTAAMRYENAHTLVVHRWAGDSTDALLILGLNRTPVALMLAEPKGRWVRQLDATDAAFGGGGPAMPGQVDLRAGGVAVTLPAYAAAVYVRDLVNR